MCTMHAITNVYCVFAMPFQGESWSPPLNLDFNNVKQSIKGGSDHLTLKHFCPFLTNELYKYYIVWFDSINKIDHKIMCVLLTLKLDGF